MGWAILINDGSVVKGKPTCENCGELIEEYVPFAKNYETKSETTYCRMCAARVINDEMNYLTRVMKELF